MIRFKFSFSFFLCFTLIIENDGGDKAEAKEIAREMRKLIYIVISARFLFNVSSNEHA